MQIYINSILASHEDLKALFMVMRLNNAYIHLLSCKKGQMHYVVY